ncbi:MAG: alpha-L-rhamnosidase, partial [Sediminibacterium sp.]|nr:alpha-L-rhamnosidase [Sediminibacterium sp.]
MEKLEYFVNKLMAMRISILGMIYLLLLSFQTNAQLTVQHLLTNNRVNPIGVDDSLTRFSWQLSGNYRNIRQQAYQITVYDAQAKNKTVWFSGKVSSAQSVMVSVHLPKLTLNKRYSWKVQVWDEAGNTAISNEPAFFQTGLLQATNWKAQWIEAAPFADSVGRPSPLFRKTFPLNKKVAQATAYITAHGLYEAYINGKRVGDGKLTPGWAVYGSRLPYQAYDVTQHLQKGLNACGVMLGSGWYRGYIGFSNQRNFYGSDAALLMQIHIQYEDGNSEILATDQSWTCSTGEVRYAELYNGETIDHGKAKNGFSLPDYDAGDWQKVITARYPLQNLIATENELITQQEIIKPVKLMKTPAGETVIDFGQNLVGWVA